MTDWKDIHSDFTEELQKEGEERGFSYEEVKEGVNIGLKISDIDFVCGLREVKKVDSDWVLNNGEHKELKKQFRKHYQGDYEYYYFDFGSKEGLESKNEGFGSDLFFVIYVSYYFRKRGGRLDRRGEFYHDSHMKKCDCSRQYIIDFLNNLSEESKVDDVIKELFKFLFGASPNQITSEDVEMMKKKLRLPLHWGGPSIHGGLLSYTKKTLSEKVINQIKHLPRYHNLNSEQKKLVDKLIRNGELKGRYKRWGLCKECNQPKTDHDWCQICNAQRFQEHFPNGTGGNEEIDKFIQNYQLNATSCQQVLEGIPYANLEDVKYLTSGGFGEVYKAKGKKHSCIKNVVLKSLHNSQNITTDFLQEITNYKLLDYDNIVNCYGISRESENGNYLMVIDYMSGGNLRDYLRNKEFITFEEKLFQLCFIAKGLNFIHEEGLIHRDFHSGNILVNKENNLERCYVSDLGLCQPVDKKESGEIYGVLPYVAPEVLRKGPHTQASDIYSFGIIAYEIFSGAPPYYEYGHDPVLALKICSGLRPRFKKKIPQLLEKLINRCGDADPTIRPTANEIYRDLHNWCHKRNEEFYQEYINETTEYNESFSMLNDSPLYSYEIHPSAIYTSRLLDFKNLPKPQNSKEINEWFYSQSKNEISVDTKLLNFIEKAQKNNLTSVFTNLELSEKKVLSGQEKNINGKVIHSNFTKELIHMWQDLEFDYKQAGEGINVGISPEDAAYCKWLKDEIKMNPEEFLNENNKEELYELFQEYEKQQFQAQILFKEH